MHSLKQEDKNNQMAANGIRKVGNSHLRFAGNKDHRVQPGSTVRARAQRLHSELRFGVGFFGVIIHRRHFPNKEGQERPSHQDHP